MDEVVCVVALMLMGSGMGDPANLRLPELSEVFWQVESCPKGWEMLSQSLHPCLAGREHLQRWRSRRKRGSRRSRILDDNFSLFLNSLSPSLPSQPWYWLNTGFETHVDFVFSHPPVDPITGFSTQTLRTHHPKTKRAQPPQPGPCCGSLARIPTATSFIGLAVPF